MAAPPRAGQRKAPGHRRAPLRLTCGRVLGQAIVTAVQVEEVATQGTQGTQEVTTLLWCRRTPGLAPASTSSRPRPGARLGFPFTRHCPGQPGKRAAPLPRAQEVVLGVPTSAIATVVTAEVPVAITVSPLERGQWCARPSSEPCPPGPESTPCWVQLLSCPLLKCTPMGCLV